MLDVKKISRAEATVEEIEQVLRQILNNRDTCWTAEELVKVLERRGFEFNRDNAGQPILWAALSRIFHELKLTLAISFENGRWQLRIYGARHQP